MFGIPPVMQDTETPKTRHSSFESSLVPTYEPPTKERKNLSVESLIILDAILSYKKDFDGKLDDFVWKTISLKVDKYKPFLLNNIDTQKYKEILRRVAL